MFKRLLLALCFLWATQAHAQFNGTNGIFALNSMSFALLPSSLSLTGRDPYGGVGSGGGGYNVNDTITLNCQDIFVIGTKPVVTVTSVSSGRVTGVSLTNPGFATKIPSTGLAGQPNGVCVFTQFATSGAGSGAAIYGVMGFISPVAQGFDPTHFGVLPVPNGGTGLGTLTTGAVLIGNGTNNVTLNGPFTAGLPIFGNGTNGLIAGTISGTGTDVATVSGTPVSGNCTSWNAGNLIDAGAPCGTGSGGSGTVTAGTVGQLAVYPSSGTTVAGLTAGTSGQVLKSNGAGVAPSWTALPTQFGCTFIEEFGGVGDGSTNNVTPINNLLAAFPSSGGCVGFQAGTYYFASSINFTYSGSGTRESITFTGLGSDVTQLEWDSALGSHNAINFAMDSPQHTFHIRNLTIETGYVASDAGFQATNSWQEGNYDQNDITDVTFRGTEGGQGTNYWGQGISTTGVSNIVFTRLMVYGNNAGTGGTGVLIEGLPSGGAKYGIVFNFTNCSFYNNGIGIEIGSYTQGITVSQSNFVNGVTGIYVPSGLSGVQSQLAVNNSNFNETGNDISIQSPLDDVILTGNLIYVDPNTTGVLCSQCAGLTATGNAFSYATTINSGQSGIIVTNNGSNAIPTAIVGNTFFGLVNGIDITGNAFSTVGINGYNDTPTRAVNGGSTVCPSTSAGNCVGAAGSNTGFIP